MRGQIAVRSDSENVDEVNAGAESWRGFGRARSPLRAVLVNPKLWLAKVAVCKDRRAEDCPPYLRALFRRPARGAG